MSFSLATAECFGFLGVVGRKRETPGICLLDKLKINLLVCKSLWTMIASGATHENLINI